MFVVSRGVVARRGCVSGLVMTIVWGCVAGCASAPPVAEPPPVVIAPAPPAATAAATASVVAPPPARRFVLKSRPIFDDLDVDTGPAPCDFARTYRGAVDRTPLTLLLAVPAPDQLGGLVHYDKPGPPLTLTGARRGPLDFTLQERGGGRFEGRCDDKGALRGTYTLGGRARAFVVHPRPADWPPLHRIARTASAEPRHPSCAREGAPDHPVEIDTEEGRVICLPTNPRARKAVLADAPHLLCSADDRGARLFGLPDPAVEKRANQLLDGGWFEAAEKRIKACAGIRSMVRFQTLVTVRRDVLVVGSLTSNDYGGAHPMNSGGDATVIDLVRGASVALGEIVDPAALREVTLSCLPFHRATAEKDEVVIEGPLPLATCAGEPSLGRLLWGCDPDGLRAPMWSLLPEGIVIGSWANAHATAVNDGRGPVIPWSVLLREKALRPASPLARVWAGTAPAPADALACPLAYWGDSLDEWQEQR